MNNSMRILIDADACPVYRIAERIAKENHIPVILFSDTNHVLTSDYSEIRVIGAGADAVDFALINASEAGDIIITQDYGVAAMALGKGAWAIHQSGKWYTNDNIDQLLGMALTGDVEGLLLNPWNLTMKLDKNLIRIIRGEHT